MLVELALVLPIMVLLLMGIFEITMYAFLNNKMVRTAGTMSSIVSMQNLSREKLAAIIDTADTFAAPFPFAGRGGVVVSHIHNEDETDDPANMVISWQESKGGFISRIGAEGDAPIDLPSNITITEDQALIVTEVFYNYEPMVFKNFIGNQLLYKVAMYVPRFGTMYPLIGEEN